MASGGEGTICATGKGTWDQEVGPIFNQEDAVSKANAYLRKHPHLTWTGHWKVTIPGTMSVINVQLKRLKRGTKTHREVQSIDEIKEGDHCFVKRPAYEHHFIVTKVTKDGERWTLHVVEYSTPAGGSSGIFSGGPKGIVQAGTYKFPDPQNEIFKVEYSECHKRNHTVMAAKKLLGLAEYNLAWGNCQHFSTACKNGNWQSDQVDEVVDEAAVRAIDYLLPNVLRPGSAELLVKTYRSFKS